MYEQHLTSEQVNRFLAQTLLPHEITGVYQHIDTCRDCRRRVLQPVAASAGQSTAGPCVELHIQHLIGEWDQPEHPAAEQMVAYVDGKLQGIDRELLAGHLSTCSGCAEEVESLRAFHLSDSTCGEEALEPLPSLTWRDRLTLIRSFPIPRVAMAAVPVAALIVLIAFFLSWGRHLTRRPPGHTGAIPLVQLPNRRHAEPESARGTQPAQNRFVQQQNRRSEPRHGVGDMALKAIDGDVYRDAGGRLLIALSGRDAAQAPSDSLRDSRGRAFVALPRQEAAGIELALKAGRQILPSQLGDLNGKTVKLGSQDSGSVRPEQPVGTFVASNRPLFRWTASSSARRYILRLQTPAPERKFVGEAHFDQSAGSLWRVTQYNEEGQPMGGSTTQSSGTTWSDRGAVSLLRPGQAYQWSIQAMADPADDAANADPPMSAARFQVLDSGRQEEVRRAAKRYVRAHLVLGILFARYGLVPEARREFEAKLRQDPHNRQALRLLAQLPRASQ